MDLFAESESWDLPATDAVVALADRLREALPELTFELREGDLYSITREERDVVLDAMAEGRGFPYVLLDGAVVHSDTLEAEPLAASLRSAGYGRAG